VTRRGMLLALGSIAVFGLLPVGCGQAALGEPPLPTYRYRLTVEVETPQGLRTGSSVIEIASFFRSKNALVDPGQLITRVQGEAVSVDLPNGQALFALLTLPGQPRGAEAFALWGFPFTSSMTGKDFVRGQIAHLRKQRGVGVIPPEYYPMLVRFADIRKSKTVAVVDPANLEPVFGNGVKLHRITVQITQDAVTESIERKLIWLHEFYNGGQINNNPLYGSEYPESNIGYIWFKRKDK
jgi:hypothetical protein